MRDRFLSAVEFASLAGISRRKATRALGRSIQGLSWRGVTLDVRANQHARGGRSGTRYEVALSSLSEALQTAFWEASGCERHDVVRMEYNGNDCRCIGATVPAILDVAPRPMPRTSQFGKQQRLLDAISPALLHPRGSSERAAAIRAAVRPDLALRTLQRFELLPVRWTRG